MDLINRYQSLVNYLMDYIYTVKIQDGLAVNTIHSPGCVSVTGYSWEDYSKDPELWYRMVYKKDRKKNKQTRLALLGEEVETVEHKIIHPAVDDNMNWLKICFFTNYFIPSKHKSTPNSSSST